MNDIGLNIWSDMVSLMDTVEAIHLMPKAELHIHLIGAIRPSTLFSIVQEHRPDFHRRTEDEIKDLFQFKTFRQFIMAYTEVADYIDREEYFEQIAYEMLEDCASRNTHYVEASFSAIDHIQRGLGFEKMIDAINKGVRRARRRFGIECNIRIDFVRNEGPGGAMRVLDLIEAKPDNIVSVDIGELLPFLAKEVNEEDLLEKKELKQMVKSSLAKLSVDYRSVLTLYYLEEKSYQNISEILQIPMGTVAIRLSRAKEKLRDIIKNTKGGYEKENWVAVSRLLDGSSPAVGFLRPGRSGGRGRRGWRTTIWGESHLGRD